MWEKLHINLFFVVSNKDNVFSEFVMRFDVITGSVIYQDSLFNYFQKENSGRIQLLRILRTFVFKTDSYAPRQKTHPARDVFGIV